MSRTYKLSQLIIDHEIPDYGVNSETNDKGRKKTRAVCDGDKTRNLLWIESSKDIESITNPEGRELTQEELFDFVIGNNITDLARA